ncbi:hypothetical protein GW17_00059181, partial [Ensete ventricosum]
FGSDFAMIQQLFPNRTRHQVKLKFKIEERKHPLQVHDALLRPSKDVLLWKQEETGGGDQEVHPNDCEANSPSTNFDEGPEELDDWKGGEANSPSTNFDGGLFDWDTCAAQDTTLWEI